LDAWEAWILQLNKSKNTLYTSGGFKHKTHSDHGIVFNPRFCIQEEQKRLIRSKPQSCSLCGTLILSGLEGCKIEVLNGPILKKSHGHYEFYA
jgi:hypothetical protein